MSFRRYEIILPTRYNDGTPVEQAKYWATTEDIVARFEAVTWQTLKPVLKDRFRQIDIWIASYELRIT